jgi:hypothetical protein
MVSYGDIVYVNGFGWCELDEGGDVTIFLVEEEDGSITWLLDLERSDYVLVERKCFVKELV